MDINHIAKSLQTATTEHQYGKDDPFSKITGSTLEGDTLILHESLDVFGRRGQQKDPKPGTVYERQYRVKMTLEVVELKVEDD